MHPIIIVILLIAAMLFISWFKRAPPGKRKKGLIYAGIAVVALLVATGRLNPLMGAIVAGVALLQRVLSAVQLLDSLKGARRPRRKSPIFGCRDRLSSDVAGPRQRRHAGPSDQGYFRWPHARGAVAFGVGSALQRMVSARTSDRYRC